MERIEIRGKEVLRVLDLNKVIRKTIKAIYKTGKYKNPEELSFEELERLFYKHSYLSQVVKLLTKEFGKLDKDTTFNPSNLVVSEATHTLLKRLDIEIMSNLYPEFNRDLIENKYAWYDLASGLSVDKTVDDDKLYVLDGFIDFAD